LNTTAPLARILVVEDDPASLTGLEEILAPLRQRVVPARTGARALSRLLKEEYALVLLDVRLSDMNGLEVARMMRRRRATRRTPVIFMTAFAETEEYLEAAYRLGAADFVFKPVIGDFLRAKVRVFVEQWQYQRTLSDLLERSQKAEQLKSEFLNLVGHEFRTPLTVLGGYLSMLSDGTMGPPSERWMETLRLLHSRVFQLNELVDNMLVASRMAAGSFPEEISRFDLRQAATDAAERARTRAELAGTEVELELGAEAVPVEADERHVGLVLDNLVSNALMYTRRSPWVRLAARRRGSEGQVQVIDHGIGLPPEVREQIFDRFVRVGRTRLPPSPGIGLGLYISRELARRHGGDVVIAASEPDRGSTFALVLPVTPSPLEGEGQHRRATRPGRGGGRPNGPLGGRRKDSVVNAIT
jgi:signal transduction histidine kinase